MERNIEEDMFAELYYHGTVKRLKEVADSRINYHSYALLTHLHRVLRNPILADDVRKKLKFKIKRIESYTKKIVKSKSKKDMSLCTLSNILDECKKILGETIFNITSAEVILNNQELHRFDGVLTIRPCTPPQMPNVMQTNEEETEPKFEAPQYSPTIEAPQYSPITSESMMNHQVEYYEQ